MFDPSIAFELWICRKVLKWKWVEKRLWLKVLILEEVLNHYDV